MSVSATIGNPISQIEVDFDLPICTESVYKKIILPIAVKNSLSFFSGWGRLTEIYADDFNEFSRQLELFFVAISHVPDVDDEFVRNLSKRLFDLREKMVFFFDNRKDIEVLIG